MCTVEWECFVNAQHDTKAVSVFSHHTFLLSVTRHLCTEGRGTTQCTDGVGTGRFLWSTKLILPYAVLSSEFCQAHRPLAATE